MEENLESIEGYVDHIIYRNADNGYTVLVLVCNEEEETCVGVFSDIAEGENIKAKGSYTEHPTYGRQFQVKSFEEKAPQDEVAIERYLGSGAIKGIGIALAARIVRRFKADTFRIIEEEPERLAEIKGISQRKAMEIADQVNQKKDLRQAMIFLQQYGINTTLAVKIYKTYGQEIYGILKENPYRMADDVEGVGFRTADEIASRVGIRTDSDFRIRSGIQYVLLQAAGEGHTYLPMQELTQRASRLLEVDPEHIEQHYMNLAMDRKIIMRQVEDSTQIYAATYFYMEANTATRLTQLNAVFDVPDIEIEDRIRKIEKKTGMDLDEHQVEAVKEAVRNGVLVITGGPGTGKTTTINTIIRYFELSGEDIMLAAPTGRAAKRMSETTGYEARTIHRMLELNGGMEGNAGFERNEQNPLETNLIIIDEMSMVDISLMNSRIYSYYCKNPQSHRVQHQHKFVIGFSSVSLQKLSFEIKNKEHNTGSKHRYQCIHRISEYSRRYHSQNNIPDHSSSHCCCHSQNTDAKNIHIALYSHHCSGSCKRHCSCHFHNKCCNRLIIHI